MNADQHPHEPPQQPPPETRAPERADLSAAMAPEAIQAADVDRDEQATQTLDTDKPTRGVDWVRPSDLMSRAGGALSRRGIDFQTEMFQHARAGIATGAKQVAAYAKRLPPLSAFGREEPAAQARGLGRD
ncbi:hypothetical protein Q7C18_03925 [Nesterenkonia sp. CL21]|uniref:hypothetical protein n=1 Tax=Nesterenkonia sp. CL21 TaxID=3064894 RepID=UPI00287B420A|nr:hypothetical protein [Nesterenkonia sp. CL21]MDS2171836.1 hypothetical protein [Nesterenkonia sp. CL21]